MRVLTLGGVSHVVRRVSERYLHVHGRQSSMGDGAAHGTSKGESRVQGKATELFRRLSRSPLHDGVELLRPGRGRWRSSCHCDGLVIEHR